MVGPATSNHVHFNTSVFCETIPDGSSIFMTDNLVWDPAAVLSILSDLFRRFSSFFQSDSKYGYFDLWFHRIFREWKYLNSETINFTGIWKRRSWTLSLFQQFLFSSVVFFSAKTKAGSSGGRNRSGLRAEVNNHTVQGLFHKLLFHYQTFVMLNSIKSVWKISVFYCSVWWVLSLLYPHRIR